MGSVYTKILSVEKATIKHLGWTNIPAHNVNDANPTQTWQNTRLNPLRHFRDSTTKGVTGKLKLEYHVCLPNVYHLTYWSLNYIAENSFKCKFMTKTTCFDSFRRSLILWVMDNIKGMYWETSRALTILHHIADICWWYVISVKDISVMWQLKPQ